jgi:uncharacterized protein
MSPVTPTTTHELGPTKRIHEVQAADVAIAYDPSTGRLFQAPEASHQSDRQPMAVDGATAASERSPRCCFSSADMGTALVAAPALQPSPAPLGPGPLDRLSIHVSHDCNLRCRYCYAGGGSYGLPRAAMAPEAAAGIVCRMARAAGKIGLVQFFGGEPLLATETIAAACDAVETRCREGVLQERPLLRVVTNLTLMSSRFAELVRQYDIEVIASCDGPQPIHDALRPYADGRASFDSVARNMARLQAATDGRQPRGIEATHTRLHQDAGMTAADVASWLCERFGVTEAIVVPAQAVCAGGDSLAPQCLDGRRDHVEHARRALRLLADSDRRLDVSGLTMAPYIMFPSRAACDHFCPAAMGTVSVMPDGDVYPCHLFIGREEFCMGNALRDQDLQRSPRYRRVWRRFRDNLKSEIRACRDCWLRLICRSCPGLMLTVNGDITLPVESDCMLKQGLTEGTLLEIASIRRDPRRWKAFVANVARAVQALRRTPLRASPPPASAAEAALTTAGAEAPRHE